MLFMDSTFCTETASVWGILGYIVLALRIVIPLALIILGMIDMGKAVIEDDEKAIGTAVGKLVRRFIAALLVFFIPVIVSVLFNAIFNAGIDAKGRGNSNYNVCVQCLLNRTSAGEICKSSNFADDWGGKDCTKVSGKCTSDGAWYFNGSQVTKAEYDNITEN